MSSQQMQYVRSMMKEMMMQDGMPQFSGNLNPEILRATMNLAQANMPIEPGVTITELSLGGVEAELSTPDNCEEDVIIMHIHGGGMICGSATHSRGYVTVLAKESNFRVYSVSYRLAPEDKFPAGVNDCFDAYKALVEMHPNTPIALIGESAGAHLSIVTTLKAISEKVKLPSSVIAYSAPTDFTGVIDRSQYAETDFTISPSVESVIVNLYCPGEDTSNPYISPLRADYTGFPPLKLVADRGETLCPDSELLAEKASKAGIVVDLQIFDGTFHAFPTIGRGTPESAKVLAESIEFIKNHR